MDYRVDQLARAAGISVDTVRFYQGRGLIERPRREGRIALYSDAHLAALRRIRGLLDQGFSLAQIRRMQQDADAADREGTTGQRSLLQALVEEDRGPRTLSRDELAREAGIPEALIQAARAAGLIEPVIDGGEGGEGSDGREERYGAADLEMARAALAVLGAGFPLDELMALARRHAGNVGDVADRAIDLFDEHVRKAGAAEVDVTSVYQRLLPQITRLVALHFQRTLVARALERLRARGDDEGLEKALAATQSGRLEVEWHS